MSTFTVQRSGFTRVPELFYAIIQDLITTGFALKYPTSALQAPTSGADYGMFKATLEATPAVDTLAAEQPWRIQFNCMTNAQIGDIYITSPLQLPNDGTVGTLDTTDGSTTSIFLPAGMVNTEGKMHQPNLTTDFATYHFLYRPHRLSTKDKEISYPMQYRLTVTSRGFVLAVWEDATDEDTIPVFSWLVVQRPVNNKTGVPLTVGHCPLFAVYGVGGKYSRFVVRESDVLKPTFPVSADSNSQDAAAIINTKSQVSITENNRYVMTFPNGLNTPRYMYTDELDLIAYTSADVVSMYSEVPITAYGEATPRKYKAMSANGAYNTGMRILMLIEGGS